MRTIQRGTETSGQNGNGKLAKMAGAEDVSLPEPCSGAEKEGDKRKMCFIHSQALLVSSDLNPRYTGRVRESRDPQWVCPTNYCQ